MVPVAVAPIVVRARSRMSPKFNQWYVAAAIICNCGINNKNDDCSMQQFNKRERSKSNRVGESGRQQSSATGTVAMGEEQSKNKQKLKEQW